ncbi:MAG: hypothetical protein GYA24_16215 [Candidatus Lokiarchaeota archaeon]|nr:hypothetical protein [Candidatus Lokiarchaeota archaeon]
MKNKGKSRKVNRATGCLARSRAAFLSWREDTFLERIDEPRVIVPRAEVDDLDAWRMTNRIIHPRPIAGS